ncbi:hypothetical protein V7O66_07570 [Methanolobus sp. ZRKC3]|uniref:hypothetical protein n=1 Tax=Methanolobus sp. ZRKC3 TaxID=3125786 RepID=UPI003249722F
MLMGISGPSILVPFLVAVAIQSVQGSKVVTMLVTLTGAVHGIPTWLACRNRPFLNDLRNIPDITLK